MNANTQQAQRFNQGFMTHILTGHADATRTDRCVPLIDEAALEEQKKERKAFI